MHILNYQNQRPRVISVSSGSNSYPNSILLQMMLYQLSLEWASKKLSHDIEWATRFFLHMPSGP